MKSNELVIENISKHFGGVAAVNNVTLRVEPGQFTSLLGPSGCGKTTTLNFIAGLEMPTDGVIRIGDFVLNDVRRGVMLPPEQRELGMVFQSYALWPHMTVYDNLNFGLGLRKIKGEAAKKRITETLELVGLGGFEKRYPFQLSGGQQQRVALARAVCAEPRLLLLDEPLSNLDAKVREHARVWLREVQKRVGITTVYVTHDQAEALAMSDMIAVMSNGSLLQYASPADVYERPINRFVADFIGATAFLEGTITAVNGDQAKVLLKGGQTITAQTNITWRDEKEVAIAIRSERVQVITDSSRTDNVITARITSSTYLGSKWQHIVETDAGSLKVESLDPTNDSILKLYLPPSAIILIPNS